jgi:hypothetical protein
VEGATCLYSHKLCVPLTIAGEGEPCATGASDQVVRCDRGLSCRGSPAVCARLLGEGAACKEVYGECGGALRCIEGTCQLPRAAGGACTSGNECASSLSCDATRVCTAGPRLAAGQACGGSMSARCADGLYCSGAGGAAGVCTAFTPLGAACTPGGAHCETFTVCAAGVCSVPDPAACR